MHVFIERDKREETLEFTGTGVELCDQLNVNPETVLILKNDTLVTEDELLENEDQIKLITVVSGG